MTAARIPGVPLYALLIAPLGVSAQQPRADYPGPHMMWESGWMFFGPLMMILFIGLIVAVVVLIVRWLGDRKSDARIPSEGKAIEILKQRFARGEIDKEEYEERRRVLED